MTLEVDTLNPSQITGVSSSVNHLPGRWATHSSHHSCLGIFLNWEKGESMEKNHWNSKDQAFEWRIQAFEATPWKINGWNLNSRWFWVQMMFLFKQVFFFSFQPFIFRGVFSMIREYLSWRIHSIESPWRPDFLLWPKTSQSLQFYRYPHSNHCHFVDPFVETDSNGIDYIKYNL